MVAFDTANAVQIPHQGICVGGTASRPGLAIPGPVPPPSCMDFDQV
jgi:hypothetical protein